MDSSPKTRVYRTGNADSSSILQTEDSISIIANKDNFIVVDDKGITIKGPVSIVADSPNIRVGGLFVGAPDLSKMIPSTIITPLPQQIPMPPIFGAVAMAADISFFLSLLC
jgi:hypothetical protein